MELCGQKVLQDNLPDFLNRQKNFINNSYDMDPVAMRHAAIRTHCPARLPRGTVVWGLGCGWTVAHGRRVSSKPRVLMVLRSFLRECCVGLWGGGGGGHGPQYYDRRVARAPYICMGATRRGALLTQQYVTAGWRSMRAVRVVRPPRTSHANPPLGNSLPMVLRNRC